MFLTKLRTLVVLSVMLGMAPLGGKAIWTDAQSIAAADSAEPAQAVAQNKKAAGDGAKGADAATDQLLGEWAGPIRPVPSWFKELADKNGQVSLLAWYKAGKDIEEFKKWDRNDDGYITWEEAVIGSSAGAVRFTFSSITWEEAVFGSSAGTFLSSTGGLEDGIRQFRIRWTPPLNDVAVGKTTEIRPIPRGIAGTFSVSEKGGKKTLELTFSRPPGNPQEFNAPFKVDGDTLTLDGGTLEIGPTLPLIKAELKGEWHRIDLKRFLRAFPGIDVNRYAYKFDLRKLLIIAQELQLEPDQGIRLLDCAVGFYPQDPDSQQPVTSVRSRHAVLRLKNPVRDMADLSDNEILSIEFADGVRMDLKEK